MEFPAPLGAAMHAGPTGRKPSRSTNTSDVPCILMLSISNARVCRHEYAATFQPGPNRHRNFGQTIAVVRACRLVPADTVSIRRYRRLGCHHRCFQLRSLPQFARWSGREQPAGDVNSTIRAKKPPGSCATNLVLRKIVKKPPG